LDAAPASTGSSGSTLRPTWTGAVAIGAFSYRSVDSILRTGLDRQPAFPPPSGNGHGHHANVRGPAYYQ
jgi:hypothetical protein